jgi:hypothetical protein
MHSEIDEKGYVVLRNFIDPEYVFLMQKYFVDIEYFRLKNDREYGAMHKKSGKEDVANTYTIYGEKLSETMLLMYGEKLCNSIGKNLSPTYSFVRFYERGDTLDPHLDRRSCEYSVTIPVFLNDHKASTIYISNRKCDGLIDDSRVTFEQAESLPEGYTRVDLMPGDALAYKGMERYHWRKDLESDLLVQFFLHYVDTDGRNNRFVFDTRPFLGYPASYRKIED